MVGNRPLSRIASQTNDSIWEGRWSSDARWRETREEKAVRTNEGTNRCNTPVRLGAELRTGVLRTPYGYPIGRSIDTLVRRSVIRLSESEHIRCENRCQLVILERGICCAPMKSCLDRLERIRYATKCTVIDVRMSFSAIW